ncbi:WD40 repeat domain-containing protein [Mucilaginibacter sp. RS28]|uniref:WD40 repeat domain-containing protein n=1 Tax=Mucilaginibacter straminoryzae TaxID=2932774 RepID=A0A9X1X3U5_9SPHI|nr:WD40 repeat domain-containing protein [Mucilaginibacter straminoryzae]MCJ8209870.1 WD40 repeat domain-containing protein [Mucilaginibacter straminoryzae]
MNATLSFELTGHQNPIFCAELSQKPGILFTAGNDRGVVEWSIPEKAFIKVMFPVNASVYALHCPEGFPYLIAGTRSGEVIVFDFIEQKVTHRLQHHIKPIFDIKTIKSKSELLVASEDGSVSVWDLKTLSLLHHFVVSVDTIRSIAISPDEQQIAFGCRDHSVRVYKAEDFSHTGTLTGHTMAVFTTAFSPDGSLLISGARDAQVKVWDSISHQLIKNIPAHLFAVNHICFHPTRPYFATASMDKSIKIWGVDDFRLYKIISREKGYPSHLLSVNKLTWNDNQLISVSDDKRVLGWDREF